VAVPGLTGRVRGPPARRSRLQDRALGQTPAGRRRRGRPRRWCARCNPRRGGRRRCGLVVSDHQVQVAAVPREGAGEGDDLEGALPGAMLSAAGEPHSDLGQAANAGQHPACLDAFAGGEGQQLGFEVGAGTQPQGDRAHAAKVSPHWGVEEGYTAGVSAGVAVLAYLANGVFPQVPRWVARMTRRGTGTWAASRPHLASTTCAIGC
jgi:hypothetical protein